MGTTPEPLQLLSTKPMNSLFLLTGRPSSRPGRDSSRATPTRVAQAARTALAEAPTSFTPSALINIDLDSERRAYLRLPKVRDLTGLPTSTIYRYIKLGQFPPPHRLGLRTVGWLQSDIEQWLASRKAA